MTIRILNFFAYFEHDPMETGLSSDATGSDPLGTNLHGNISHVLCDNTDVSWYENVVHCYSGQF